ncbi:MAG: HAD hydrolase family protein [Armatimonadetes bacterium]|nr:HAD hydrolase family protein [Armatimonadota bacterium]
MKRRLAKVKMLVMDVDGTLTDGSMTFIDGEQIKTFNVHDGLGIRLAMSYGLGIAWVTGNTSSAVDERARQLGIVDIYQGSWYKPDSLREIAARHELSMDQIAYIGDDLNDLPAFEVAGFSFAVRNATEYVKARADMVTRKSGGQGAVREAIEIILKAGGQWEDAVRSFLSELEKDAASKRGPEAIA